MHDGRRLRYGRLAVLRLLITMTAVVLIARLWQLQMLAGEQYRLLADQNRLREVDVAAARGVIYDRNGLILARNRPSFSVAIIPGDLPTEEDTDKGVPEGQSDPGSAVVTRLLELLSRPVPTPSADGAGATPAEQASPAAETPSQIPIAERSPWIMTREEIDQKIKEGRLGGAYRPVTVARYIREATAFLVAEDSVNLPGVQLVLEPIRDYPSGPQTSHVVGYMGLIPKEQLESYENLGYRQDEQVGLAGLEVSFEEHLRGNPGRQTIEVDVNGRRVRTVGEEEPAVAGHNLILSLDSELQRVATEALQATLDQSSGFTRSSQGVAIALDPRSGKVRALVSLPSYDNNLFAKGITAEAFATLTQDPDLPLFNQAIAGQYPPGSTFKIIVAAAGLQEGVINVRTRLGDGFDGVNDGIIWLPNEYFPWDPKLAQAFYSWTHKYGYGHGLDTVRDALAVSDDIFFYQLGGGYLDQFKGLGSKRVGEYASAFGLGAYTGIELPGEARGLVPDSRWKRINYAENWLTGDTYNMSIGQGYILATPLQMANATAAVANRGFLWQPQLVDRIVNHQKQTVREFQPRLLREIRIAPEALDIVREGMYGTVNWANGTATSVRAPGIAIAGKTGTAEFYRDNNKDGKEDRDEKGNLPTHAWFTAFAPYIDPEIVVTVFVANGGEGSAVAAPVATRMLQAYFAAGAAAQGSDTP